MASPRTTPVARKVTDRIVAATLVIAALASVVARWVFLDGGFWFDEHIVARVVTAPMNVFWDFLRLENHPPLYFLLARGWAALFGAGEVALRTLSVIAGLLAIVAVGWAGRTLFGRTAGWVSAALSAFCPILVFYSREARMYSLVVLLAAVSIGAFWRMLQRPTPISATFYLLVTLAGLASHYSFAVLVAAQAATFVFDRRHHRISLRQALPAALLLGAVAALWVAYNIAPRVLHPLGLPSWFTAVNPDRWAGVNWFMETVTFDRLPFGYLLRVEEQWYYLLQGAARIAFLGLASVGVVRALRCSSDQPDAGRRPMTYLVLIAAAFSLVGFATSSDVPKFFLPAVVALIIIVAQGFVELRRTRPLWATAGLTVYALFAFGFLPILVRGQEYPWRYVAAYLQAHEQPGDLILVHTWINADTLERYYHGQATVRGLLPLDVGRPPNDLTVLARYNPVRVLTPENIDWLETVSTGYRRIWFVIENDGKFWNGPLVQPWLLAHGWAIVDEPRVLYTPKGYLTLFQRYGDDSLPR